MAEHGPLTSLILAPSAGWTAPRTGSASSLSSRDWRRSSCWAWSGAVSGTRGRGGGRRAGGPLPEPLAQRRPRHVGERGGARRDVVGAHRLRGTRAGRRAGLRLRRGGGYRDAGAQRARHARAVSGGGDPRGRVARSGRRGAGGRGRRRSCWAPWVLPNLVRFETRRALDQRRHDLRGALRRDLLRTCARELVTAMLRAPDVVRSSRPCAPTGGRATGSLRPADHPGRVPAVVARVGRALDLYGAGLPGRRGRAATAGPPRLLGRHRGVLDPGPLAAVGFAAPVAWRWLLLAPVVTVAIRTVAFYGGHRIRSPLEPVTARRRARRGPVARHLLERLRGERPSRRPNPRSPAAPTS